MTSGLTVETGDPRSPAALKLLKASHALMEQLFPSEANHYLSIDALCTPEIHFVVGKRDGVIAGCGALAEKNGYAEIKSMFVAEEARGSGLADAILKHLEDVARAHGTTMLRLETGSLLKAAHKLYARHGFRVRGPFGEYPDGPYNVFMEKQL